MSIVKEWKISEKESLSDYLTMKNIFQNTIADRLTLLIKSLIKIMLLFMKLGQFLACLISFYEKDLNAKKRKSSQN